MYDIAIGIIIGFLLICLVVIFCGITIKLYIKKVKEHNHKELAFQKAINTAILETQEQVLNNISQDLHDDAGQQLTYINFQLEHLKLDVPELQTQLEPLSQSVRNLSRSIRSISHSLNNQLLLQQDLCKAIATEVERLQKTPKIKILFTQDDPAQKNFSTHEKIVIYRIFQEGINNSFKHAKATEIRVTLTTQPHFIMTIADNGKGFDPQVPHTKPALGLQNMTQRAAIINYHLTLQSAISQGTTITLSEHPL